MNGRGWVAISAAVALLVALPVASLGRAAWGGDLALWAHLLQYVLPDAARDTLLLLVGVGALVVGVGTSAAWLVTAYDFPGRRLLDGALLLPLAVPTYIVAYAYLDLLHPIGPVQTALRGVLGVERPAGLWFPEVRTLPGAVLLLGFVLYPYVYMPTRAMFLMQSASLIEAARTLGLGRRAVFFRVALPLARPAIAVGTSLALMEALNDVGASEFLGVRTLTLSIYTTWVGRSDLAGAAQIALAMLIVVAALVGVERWARQQQRYAVAAQRSRRMTPERLTGPWAALAFALGATPVVVGFVAPTLFLIDASMERVQFAGLPPALLGATWDTVRLAALTTALLIPLGLAVAYAVRVAPGRLSRGLERVAGLGYAVPGTVLAIGLLGPLGAFDRLAADLGDAAGIGVGLMMLGSGGALVYAYCVRFLAVSVGGVESGLGRIPPSLDQAARTLGASSAGVLVRVHLPLLRPALAAASLLVFVDVMKELPATLLLRPLGVETLATRLYAEASRGTYEDGAIAALIIVAVGLLPVGLLARVGSGQDRRQT